MHVGYGTFEPVRVDDVNTHEVSSERFEITFNAAQRINQSRERGGRIVAVGTTTTRALESASTDNGQVQPGSSEATLTIKPGYQFRVVDALLTNFHLPQSSLLILLCSFAGRDLVLQAYRHESRNSIVFTVMGLHVNPLGGIKTRWQKLRQSSHRQYHGSPKEISFPLVVAS